MVWVKVLRPGSFHRLLYASVALFNSPRDAQPQPSPGEGCCSKPASEEVSDLGTYAARTSTKQYTCRRHMASFTREVIRSVLYHLGLHSFGYPFFGPKNVNSLTSALTLIPHLAHFTPDPVLIAPNTLTHGDGHSKLTMLEHRGGPGIRIS